MFYRPNCSNDNPKPQKKCAYIESYVIELWACLRSSFEFGEGEY
jgi:hypothetical protein